MSQLLHVWSAESYQPWQRMQPLPVWSHHGQRQCHQAGFPSSVHATHHASVSDVSVDELRLALEQARAPFQQKYTKLPRRNRVDGAASRIRSRVLASYDQPQSERIPRALAVACRTRHATSLPSGSCEKGSRSLPQRKRSARPNWRRTCTPAPRPQVLGRWSNLYGGHGVSGATANRCMILTEF